MTDLERHALLGDRQAQEECTRQEVVLPCPCCGGNGKIVKRKFKTGFYPSGGTYYVHCTVCLVTTQPRRQKAKALGVWNTRPAAPVGRCGECALKDTFDCICSKNGYTDKIMEYCSFFVPKEGE